MFTVHVSGSHLGETASVWWVLPHQARGSTPPKLVNFPLDFTIRILAVPVFHLLILFLPMPLCYPPRIQIKLANFPPRKIILLGGSKR
jgi:hypothetical protein